MAKMMKCAAAAKAAVEAAKAEAEKYGLLKARDTGEPRCVFDTHNSECRVIIVNVAPYVSAFRVAGFTEVCHYKTPAFMFEPERMAEAAAIVERGKKSDERRKMQKLSILKVDDLDLEGIDFGKREIGAADVVATFSPSAVSDVDSLARHKIVEHASALFALTREETDDGEILKFPGGWQRAVIVEERLEFRLVQRYTSGQHYEEEEVLEVFDTLADAKEALYSRSVDVAGGELEGETIDYEGDGYRVEIRRILIREVYGLDDIDEAEVYEVEIYD